MATKGKDHGGIAFSGFEHTLRTSEAKERLANEKVQPTSLSLAEQIKLANKEKNERIAESLKPVEVVEEKVRFGNINIEITQRNRLIMKAEAEAKGRRFN